VIDRTLAITGVVEGFYGTPWSWPDRRFVARHAGEHAMTHYVWAPKDDPRHRARWAEPHDIADLAGFEALADDGHVVLGYGIAPLDLQVHDPSHLGALWAKVVSAVERGAGLVMLCLDDMAVRPDLGQDHAGLVRWLHDRLDGRATLAVVPTHYSGCHGSAYLDAFATGVPGEIPVAWTGPAVANVAVGVADARARAACVGGRAPLLWDNFVANDGLLADRLFLGPLTGRDPELRRELSGYLVNGARQPRSCCLPLTSAAAWIRGGDPRVAWQREATDLAVLARACDGRDLASLAAEAETGAVAPELREFLTEAAQFVAPAEVAREVAPWAEQMRVEAAAGLAALDVIEGRGETTQLLVALMFRWPTLPRAQVSVFGPRRSVMLHLTQDADVRFQPSGPLFEEDANVVDRLVRAALAGALGR
jgi:hyaluronoglucosaminidase